RDAHDEAQRQTHKDAQCRPRNGDENGASGAFDILPRLSRRSEESRLLREIAQKEVGRRQYPLVSETKHPHELPKRNEASDRGDPPCESPRVIALRSSSRGTECRRDGSNSSTCHGIAV